jgi:hypothetical protein
MGVSEQQQVQRIFGSLVDDLSERLGLFVHYALWMLPRFKRIARANVLWGRCGGPCGSGSIQQVGQVHRSGSPAQTIAQHPANKHCLHVALSAHE